MERKAEFEMKLRGYVLSYLCYKKCLEREVSEKYLLKVLDRYTRAEEKLLDFQESTYGWHSLPNVDACFSEETGKYSDFAYRIYKGVWDSGQYTKGTEWSCYMLMYTAEVVRKKLSKS